MLANKSPFDLCCTYWKFHRIHLPASQMPSNHNTQIQYPSMWMHSIVYSYGKFHYIPHYSRPHRLRATALHIPTPPCRLYGGTGCCSLVHELHHSEHFAHGNWKGGQVKIIWLHYEFNQLQMSQSPLYGLHRMEFVYVCVCVVHAAPRCALVNEWVWAPWNCWVCSTT